MAAYGHVSGYGVATGIGVLLVVTLVALITAIRHRHRRRLIAGNAAAALTPAAQQRGTGAASTHGTLRQREASTPRLIRKDRIALLIAEGLVVRERLAGDIDAAGYQSRMHELACGRRT